MAITIVFGAGQAGFAQAVVPTAKIPAAVAGDSPKMTALMQSIAIELKKLRLELLEERCERQQTKLAEVEHELELVRNQQRELEEEQNSEAREATEIDSQLGQSGLSSQQREELEARKADLLATGPSRFGSSEVALAQRETQVRERVALEQQHIQFLVQQAQELAPNKN